MTHDVDREPQPDNPGDVLTRISERMSELTAGEAKVAQYISELPEQALLMSAVQLGDVLGASDMTVVRTARSLGFTGWPELRRALGSQLALTVHPAKRLSTRLTVTKRESHSSLLDIVFEEARERLATSRSYLDAEEFSRAVRLVTAAGTVHSFGVGVSSASAEYLTTKLLRRGIVARTAHGMGFAFADSLLGLRAGDLLVAFAPGREFSELDVAFAEARRLGASTILFTDKYRDAYVDRVDCVLRTASSAGGLTGENFPPMVAIDALVLAVGHVAPESALETSRRLNKMRRALRRQPGAAKGTAPQRNQSRTTEQPGGNTP
ncbi:MurR/RpiR family transcriptional regulator [Leucobacter aridicollis]|uniref:MurR/RpiR family transcriptional regulator n=1 Tax=Leucobacter aridicollis TaxID=283878 RepID=UPI00216A6F60|nr:MurR/RpiR family transcriptional regulator [Leucobacter aridicollis]MCS3426515.1 DNA-binding MurR/RpiR family transcriptional regulator [Leucobacter aridicollis]